MEAIALGSPPGQSMELILALEEGVCIEPDCLAWIGDGIELDRGSWGALGRLVRRAGPRPTKAWIVLEASRRGARAGLCAPWGRSLAVAPGPEGLLVQADSLAALPAGLAARRAGTRRRLPGWWLECPPSPWTVLAGRGGLVHLPLALGQEVSCLARQTAAMDADVASRVVKASLPGFVRLTGPGSVWLHGGREARQPRPSGQEQP